MLEPHPDLTPEVIHGLGWIYMILFVMNGWWALRSYNQGAHTRVRLLGLLGEGQEVPTAGFWAFYSILLSLVGLAHLTNTKPPELFLLKLPEWWKFGVDFLVAGGLKWLLGGPGTAFLYVRRDLIDRLHPHDVGWFAHADQFGFDVRRFTYAADARRFEGGTPSVAATYAARAGLEVVLEVGVDALRERQVALVAALVEGARRRGLDPRVPGRIEDLAGIVTIPRREPQAVVKALAARGIIIDSRPGLIRLSPYFYNLPEDGDRVLDAIVDLDRAGIR